MENLDKEFKKLAKKSKWKRALITVGISTVVVIALGLAIVMTLDARATKSFTDLNRSVNIYNEIATPNLTPTSSSQSSTFSSNDFSGNYLKNIDGYQQLWGRMDFSGNTLGTGGVQYPLSGAVGPYNQYNNGNYSSDNGKKVATFFTVGYSFLGGQPPITSPAMGSIVAGGITVTHEASTLKSLPNSLAEVAVTFKRPYSYAEIQKMIPSKLMINWYWLGLNAQKIDASGLPIYIGINSGLGVTEQTYKDYGLFEEKFPGSSGNSLDGYGPGNNYWQFAADVKAASKYLNYHIMTDSGKSFNIFEDAAKQIQKYPTLAKARFAGVILTGRSENLASLDSQPWAYATSIGVTTPILPWQTPLK